MVTASGGHHQSAFGVCLSAHVAQRRRLRLRCLARCYRRRWFRQLFRFEQPHHIEQRRNREDANVAQRCEFALMCCRSNQTQASGACPRIVETGRRAKGAAHSAQIAVKRQLPQKLQLLQVPSLHLFAGRQQGDGDGQVVATAMFGEVRGGQIHDDATLGKLEAAALQRTADAISGFAHGNLRHAD